MTGTSYERVYILTGTDALNETCQLSAVVHPFLLILPWHGFLHTLSTNSHALIDET